MNPKVDFYFKKANKWQQELNKLRQIILDCHLTEELKWGVPCYTYNDSNVILIHDFKDYCAVLFPKGALLKDPKKILIQQTKNVQAARQVRFTSMADVEKLETVLKDYIYKAVEIEEAGLKVELKKTEDYEMPEELQQALAKNRKLKTAFESLTPGRQRAYIFNVSSAKQAKTREARVEKYTPQILAGKGLDD
jgi:uncharacterized protein YdeI (YjbR/CyaY-like superfamily)